MGTNDNDLLGLAGRDAELSNAAVVDLAKQQIAVQLASVAENTNKLINVIKEQMAEENTTRKELIDYFKMMLCKLLTIPVFAFVTIYFLTGGHLDLEKVIIVFLVTLPIEVIGIFHVIASKLFDDPYRKTVPEMLAKMIGDLKTYK